MQIFDFRTWVQDEEWWFLLSIFSKIEGEIWEVGHPLLGDYVSFSNFYHHFLITLVGSTGLVVSCWIIYGKFPPASWTDIIMRRQNVLLQSTFPIKLYHNSIFNFLVTLILFYQPEEHPRVSQIYANKSFRVKSLFSNFLCTIKELTRATSNRSKNKQR